MPAAICTSPSLPLLSPPSDFHTVRFYQHAPEKIPYAIERYIKEANRLYGVFDWRLARCEFIAGDGYTIADIAAYPWIVPWKQQQQDLDRFPNLRRWFNAVRERPAAQRAYAKGEPYASRPASYRGGQEDTFRPDGADYRCPYPVTHDEYPI
jgi:GST-like protein